MAGTGKNKLHITKPGAKFFHFAQKNVVKCLKPKNKHKILAIFLTIYYNGYCLSESGVKYVVIARPEPIELWNA